MPAYWSPAWVLAAVGWWSWSFFATLGFSMPGHLWAALIIGVVLSLVVGCGLMFLVFYSSRKGYDEAVHRIDRMKGGSGVRMNGQGKQSGKTAARAAREKRLAEALRANLRKRKAAAKAMASAPQKDPREPTKLP